MVTRAAIIPAGTLGDGLIDLALANNLSINGYDVTYYSDVISGLDEYIDGIVVRPCPDYAHVKAKLEDSHIILYSTVARYIAELPDDLDEWIAGNGVCYSTSHLIPRHQSITEAQLQRRLPADEQVIAGRLVKLNRSLRTTKLQRVRPPVVRQIVDAVSKELQLKKWTYENGLRIPKVRRTGDVRRVVIHPMGSKAYKRWQPGQFLELAAQLERTGWKPVFTVSPAEREQWLKLTGGKFDVPLFATIKELAEYYNESVAFIGNDSGNAHLASCIGLPVILIYRRWRRYPPWRPAWNSPRVVYPRTLFEKGWQARLPVSRVYRAFSKMVSEFIR